MKRIAVISDTQIPFEDKRALSNVIAFIGQTKPDEVVHVGDLMDYPQPSSWSKNSKEEFEGSVFKDSELGKRYLGDLRKVYAGPIKVIEGNHDLRPRAYLAKWAPALAETNQFNVDVLLDFDGHGVELVKGFYDFTADWTITHGHLGFTLSQLAGRTAQLAANRIGKSVVMGHTHRLAVSRESFGYQGKITTRTGFEVGHLMDIKKAVYLKSGGANWQQGFGVLDIDGGYVNPQGIPVHKDGSFLVDGFKYGGK
ncbi:metallophosphoesterase family protein [Streptosporangium canum]|uniref:metallophosphoesterase family protein n=1 Tax=Streptosporangium canum TaxID=324952 RepID=UPI0036CB535A